MFFADFVEKDARTLVYTEGEWTKILESEAKELLPMIAQNFGGTSSLWLSTRIFRSEIFCAPISTAEGCLLFL